MAEGDEDRNPGDPKIRGSVINGYLSFIRKKWGSNAVDECAKVLGRSPESFVEAEWYSYEFSKKLLTWIADNKGLDQLENLGRFTVQNMGLLAYIVRFMDVKSVIKRSPKSYQDAFNFGRIEVFELKAKSCIFHAHGVSRLPHSCAAWKGVCEGFLAATRTKGTVSKTKCVFEGDDFCEYKMVWE